MDPQAAQVSRLGRGCLAPEQERPHSRCCCSDGHLGPRVDLIGTLRQAVYLIEKYSVCIHSFRPSLYLTRSKIGRIGNGKLKTLPTLISGARLTENLPIAKWKTSNL
jgi:hypothetical protein